MLVKFIQRGFRVEFVPIQTIYRGERSKIRPLSDTWRWLQWYAALIRETSRSRSRNSLPCLPENSVCGGK